MPFAKRFVLCGIATAATFSLAIVIAWLLCHLPI